MKNILFILVSILMFGCTQEPNTKHLNNSIIFKNGKTCDVYEWNYKNHTYIIVTYNNNVSITHAGSCDCNSNNN